MRRGGESGEMKKGHEVGAAKTSVLEKARAVQKKSAE